MFRFSASQIKTFRLCPRKWAYQKLDRIPEIRQGDGAESGTRLHAELEQWLKTGERPPVDSPVWWVLPYLPLPGEPMEVEYAFELMTNWGEATGFMDVFIKDTSAVTMPPHLSKIPDGSVLIIDHKSCKTPRYIPSESELQKDPQALLYGLVARTVCNLPPEASVWLSWNYFTRKEPVKVYPIVIEQTAEHFIKGMTELKHDILRMKELFEANTKASKVNGDQDGCGSFGGCYMRESCEDSDRNKPFLLTQIETKSTKEPPKMSSAAIEKARALAAKAKVKIETVDAPPPAPTPEPVTQELEIVEPAVVQQLVTPEPTTKSVEPDEDRLLQDVLNFCRVRGFELSGFSLQRNPGMPLMFSFSAITIKR